MEQLIQLEEFRKVPGSEEEFEIPLGTKRRHVTDKKGFIMAALIVALLIPLLTHTLLASDIRRLTHPVDNCGNLCGVRNSKIDGIECSGKDYTTKPYLIENFVLETVTCTEECPPQYKGNMGNCSGYINFLQVGSRTISNESKEFIWSLWWKFLLIDVVTIGLCILMLISLRFIPGTMIWVTIVSGLSIMTAILSLSWYRFSQADAQYLNRTPLLVFSIIWSVVTAVVILLVILLFKKIRLVTILFKHSVKAVFVMPSIVLVPMITVVLQLATFGLAVLASLFMLSSGHLERTREDKHEYVMNLAAIFAITFTCFSAILVLLFFSGCQYMICAGSMAHWFFAMNRLYLNSPVWTSFTNTLRFHLGTVVLGSFILLFMSVVKLLVKSLCRFGRPTCVVCGWCDSMLYMLSENAYIETAIHGQSFVRSGKRAAKLLLENAGSLVVINSVGTFVNGFVIFVFLCFSSAISYVFFLDIQPIVTPMAISFLINLITVLTVFSIFETIVDTVLLCVWEDKCLNNGGDRPYFMSKNFMKIVQKADKIYKGSQR